MAGLFALACLLAMAGAAVSTARPAQFAVLILGGEVVDGSGAAPYRADIGLRGGRIAAIGNLHGARAPFVIDARGLVVAPGFIDMHAHSDAVLLQNGGCCSKIYEGVTTEILGETPAVAVAGPLAGPALRQQQRLFAAQGVTVTWTRLRGYFQRLQQQGIRVNVASYATFGCIREAVLGLAPGAPTLAQLARERAMMAQAMRDGALGLATAFSYAPDVFARDAEVIAVARVAARYGGIYATHVRGLGDIRAGGIQEAIRIARAARLPLHIFHLQVDRGDGPRAAATVLGWLQQARRHGLQVTADAYPYRAAANPAVSMVPARFRAGGAAALLRRLANPALHAAIVRGIAASARRFGTARDPGGWREEYVSSVARAGDRQYVGKTFQMVGVMMNRPPAEAVARLLRREGGNFGRIFFNKSAASVREIITAPFVSIGGDAIDADLADATGYVAPHPRYFGTQTRVLVWAREGRLSLPAAVFKMTGLAAQTLHLRRRGLIRLGYAADLAIFNPRTVQDHATYAHPWRYSAGMEDVLVNGVPILWRGRLTTARPGQILHGPGWRAGPHAKRGREGRAAAKPSSAAEARPGWRRRGSAAANSVPTDRSVRLRPAA
ncbi:MAG: N-acyl-D-amino-acid deacylase family protein [Terriglobales bacterium]